MMEKLRRYVVDWSIPFLMIGLLSVWTYQRNSLWNNELELWKDCAKKSPQKERIFSHLGFVYHERGQLDEAEKELDKALGLNPRYAPGHYNLGLTFYKKGRMDNAIDEFKKTLELDPHFSYALYNLGLSYFRKGLYQNAIETYKEFLKLDPYCRNARINLGVAYGGLQQWNKAIEVLEEELEYFPENFNTHVYLGIVYRETKDYPKALVHFRKALAHPDLPNAEWVREVIASIEAAAKKEERVGN